MSKPKPSSSKKCRTSPNVSAASTSVSAPRDKVRARLAKIAGLTALLKHCRIPNDSDWDYLVIGDGSGSTWQRAVGWSASCIVRATGHVEQFSGFATRG